MYLLTTDRSPAAFRSFFNDTILLADNPSIDHRVAFHTDLSVFSFGDTVICAPFLFDFLSEKLKGTEVIRGEASYSPYPYDIRYNAALAGKRLFCNIKHTSEIVLSEAEKRGIKAVNVSQGYSRCSTVTVTDSAIISSDVSVAKAAEKEGMDVLFVSNEGVLLPGFKSGFIGGTAVSLCDSVVFAGDLNDSPDAGKIIGFIEMHGKKTVYFKDVPLSDIGSPAVVF